MAIGEAGSLTRGGFGATEDVRIDFTQPIDNAVIMLTSSNAGGNEFSLTVTSVDANGFTFRVNEWEDEDGPHPATETINWLAVKEGVHALSDGRLIEAGTTTGTTTSSAVSLDAAFSAPPVVLTNVMSFNDTHVSDSDPSNITASGFDLILQEGSLADGVNTGETVGYIAIQGGGDAVAGTASVDTNLTTAYQSFGLGDTFTDPIMLAETQTLNDSEAGNVHFNRGASTTSTESLKFDEETGNGESAHVPESVGIVAFENGIIPCFTPGTLITTHRGQIDVARLKIGDRVLTRDQGFQPVRWVCQTHLEKDRLQADTHLRPIRIKKDAIAPGIPSADMQVSPQHRMLITGWQAEMLSGVGEVFVPAKALINGTSVRECVAAQKVTYMHVLFDEHQVIYANGASTESLHAGQIDKAELAPKSRAELLALFPDLALGYGDTARTCLSVSQAMAYAA